MGLTLLVGPANAGKVALLLDRYVASLDRDPVLIVPNRSDVDRVERDLLRRVPALLGGSIGTFDDLFERLARGAGTRRPAASETLRALVLRRAISRTPLDGLTRSARFGGFAEALDDALRDLGYLRELLNRIQTLRKEMGLDFVDRIRVTIAGSDRTRRVVTANDRTIGSECLAVEVRSVEDAGPGGGEIDVEGDAVRLRIERATPVEK